MIQNKKVKPAIRDIKDLSRMFVKTLKDVSESGESLTFEALSENLSRNAELVNLIELANKNVETLAQPILEDEIERLKTKIENMEAEHKNIINQFIELEYKLDREKDFHKRFSLTLLRMFRTPENESYQSLFDEYRELITEDAGLDRREGVLADLKNFVMKSDLAEKNSDETTQKRSLLGNLLKPGRGDTLKQLKKACLQSLSHLELILGKEYGSELEKTQERIRETEDFDYLLSLRNAVLDVIENFASSMVFEKETVTGFLKEIGEKLEALENGLADSNTVTQNHHRDDLAFNENLEFDIKNMRLSVEKIERFEDLKSLVLSRLETIREALSKKREEYTIRIENAEKNSAVLHQHFKKMITGLQEQNKILEEKSRKDPLTGVYNRRVLKERLNVEFERFLRYKTPFSLIFFDIDNFKKVNDAYGHEAGDRALKGIATSSLKVLRKTDVFTRYGGEEFVTILLETTVKQAVTVAAKLRELIQSTEFEYKGQIVPITISAGVTEARESDPDPESAITRADKLLYRAKQMGRNRVVSDLDIE